MFEPFSNSYYIGRLFVTPAEQDRPRIQQRDLEWINEKLLYSDASLDDLARPIVMKLGARHFPVHGDEDVPEGTLALPDDLIDETDVQNPPSMCGVLLATGERANQLLWLSGHASLDVGT